MLAPYGYHVPVLAAALLSAVNLMYASLVLREPPRHLHRPEAIRLKALSVPGVLKGCVIYFIFTMGVSQLESVFAFYMMDRFHYDAMHVAWILAAMAVVMVAIQGGMLRHLARRFGETRLMVAGLGLLAKAGRAVPSEAEIKRTVGALLKRRNVAK